MGRWGLVLLTACAVLPRLALAGDASGAAASVAAEGSRASAPWPVEASLRATLARWAERQGWPSPQFMTDADWPVDVPGSIPGPIEDALRVLASGFGRAASRPRIELTANHVLVLTEMGAE